MRKWIILIGMITLLASQASALDLEAPTVPDAGAQVMPQEPESFSQGLWELCRTGLYMVQPAIKEAAQVCIQVIVIAMLSGLLATFSQDASGLLSGISVVASGYILFHASTSLIQLSADTIQQLSEYGKLLVPVMTSALAAQGGIHTSTALYAGTTAFNTLLSSLISGFLVPAIYIFLALGIAAEAFPQELLKKLRDSIKKLATGLLKNILYVFTGYMTITGVISGSADAMAVKATKLTISGMVPVVGSILSDASESVLVSVGVMKNSVGVYGMLAILSVCLSPFLKIGCQYLLLKLAAVACETLPASRTAGIVQTFSSAMGLLLGMTGAICLMLLVSTVCFMKGMS